MKASSYLGLGTMISSISLIFNVIPNNNFNEIFNIYNWISLIGLFLIAIGLTKIKKLIE